MSDSAWRSCRSRRRAAALGLLVLAALTTRPARAQSSFEALQTFSALVNQVRQNYVDSVTTPQLVLGAIRGMLASLDPHSYFQTGEEFRQMVAWRAGELAGAGVVIDDQDGDLVVQAVMAGGPGARAGVLPGDRLVSLNDTVVSDLGAARVMQRLIGARGTAVTMLLERGPRLEAERFTVRLRFDALRPRAVSVARSLPSGVGYVRLEEFLPEAGRELRQAAARALRGNPKRLILDLRGNPGGAVQAAVDVAAEFLERDQVVFSTRGRRRGVGQDFRTARDGGLRDVTVVVLINEHTASAAEALAGSLQDHDRAFIVGRRSFGKALMQQALLVPPNDDVAWLTVGYVITPSGRLIQRQYRGLTAAQYRSLAGHGGANADSAPAFRTDAGRPVTAGGGITPDSATPAPSTLPVWVLVAADSGLDNAVADSVAATLTAGPDARDAWTTAPAEWRSRVLAPYLQRVRERLHVRAEPDGALEDRLARSLARRVAEVRWGEDAALDLWLRHDPDVRAAEALFPALPRLLRPAG